MESVSPHSPLLVGSRGSIGGGSSVAAVSPDLVPSGPLHESYKARNALVKRVVGCLFCSSVAVLWLSCGVGSPACHHGLASFSDRTRASAASVSGLVPLVAAALSMPWVGPEQGRTGLMEGKVSRGKSGEEVEVDEPYPIHARG